MRRTWHRRHLSRHISLGRYRGESSISTWLYSIADLEQITGMTQANVKVRLFRCRNRLARMLKTDKDLEK